MPGGVEGGVPGGVVGGIVGGIEAAPPPPPQVVRVGGQVREPRKVRHVAPVYPRIALNAKVEGVVILECTISPQGRVERVQVLRGIPTLDEAAVDAVKQWAYTPTLVGGVPVAVVLTVTVNFVLHTPGPERGAGRWGRRAARIQGAPSVLPRRSESACAPVCSASAVPASNSCLSLS